MATKEEAARWIIVSDAEFSKLLDDGVIERKTDDNYQLDEVVRPYIRHLRRAIAGTEADEGVFLATDASKMTRQ
jgi:hypothetical protein